MNNLQHQVTLDHVAHDFIVDYHGKFDNTQLNKVSNSIKSTTTAYGAKGSVASIVLWERFQVALNDNGKQFNGDAWGLSFPGGGALIGDVYTSDMSRLLADTYQFGFTATPVYTAIYFYDKSSNFLGHFQAGSISTVTGTGGGKGSWS